MDKLDEFLDKTGIELLPYQKEILRHAVNGEKFYVLYPPCNGRYYFQNLLYLMPILLSKGENDGNRI